MVLNGVTERSMSSSITFTVPNATYSFTAGTVAGYLPTPSSGHVNVVGQPILQPIAFMPGSPGPYAVTFIETGLPSGTNWTVTLNGTQHVSNTSLVNFSELDGQYSFTVGDVTGYSATPSSGSFNVSGTAVNQSVGFASKKGFLGLPGLDGYYLVLGALALAAILLAVALARRRRGRKPTSALPPRPPADFQRSPLPPR
jgi:hypothetical protein